MISPTRAQGFQTLSFIRACHVFTRKRSSYICAPDNRKQTFSVEYFSSTNKNDESVRITEPSNPYRGLTPLFGPNCPQTGVSSKEDWSLPLCIVTPLVFSLRRHFSRTVRLYLYTHVNLKCLTSLALTQYYFKNADLHIRLTQYYFKKADLHIS